MPDCRTRAANPPTRGDGVERGQGRGVHEGERGEGERLEHRHRLDDEEELALVGPVGDQTGPRAEDEDRAELEKGEQAEGVMPLSVRRSTRSVRATMVSQLPIWEISWPPKKSLKLRDRSERNVPPSWAFPKRLMVPVPRRAPLGEPGGDGPR